MNSAMEHNINIIVCIAGNNAIGKENRLLYRLRDDLRRFKALTTGHTVLMGRRTFESLPKGALPNRRNIVLTTQELQWPQTETYASMQEALEHCRQDEEIFVIGGSSVYKEALPLAQTLYLTEVDDIPESADTFFPTIDKTEWNETERQCHQSDEHNEKPFSFVVLKRKAHA